MQPNFESISLYGEKEVITDKVKIENKTDISAEENKIILKSAEVFYKNAEVENGNLKYSIRVIFYSAYTDAEGQIKKYESGTDYDGTIAISDIKDKVLLCVDFNSLKVDAVFDGGNYTLSTTIEVRAVFDTEVKINALSGGDELICDNKEIEKYSLVVSKKATYPVSDEIELQYSVKDVLSMKAEPIVTEVQCGVGTIIVDGEICLHLLLLQNGEKGCIINENKRFSFRAEVDAEEVSLEDIANACVNIKSQKIDISVDEDKNISIANVTINLLLNCRAYKKESVMITADAFCKQNEVELVRENTLGTFFETKTTKEAECNIVANINSNDKKAKYVGTANEKVEVAQISSDDDKTAVDGVITYTVIYCDEDGKVYSEKVESPMSIKIDKLDSTERICKIVPYFYDMSIEGDSVNGKCKLFVEIENSEKMQIKYISSAELGGEKKVNDSAISVYLAINGEDSWSLAKRLNVTPEELLMLNGDLSFPLSGKERIVVYRKK